MPANTASIAGNVYIDTAGNGAASLGAGQASVQVHLYADTNQNGVLDSADPMVATKTTATDGSYSFTGLAAGTYFVKESVPSNYVRTLPTTASSYLTETLAAGQAVSGQNFANFQELNTSVVSNISFTITSPDGTQTTVTNLRGQTRQGDTVTANFTVAPTASNVTVSLVAYDAPGSSFDANTASQQTPVEIVSGTFGPGPQSLTVQVPQNYYQIDFVMGAAIQQLGPAGSNMFYSAQDRLLSADNGGTVAPALSSLSGTVTSDNSASMMPNTGLTGATVTLTGTNDLGQVVNVSVATDTNGNYLFTGLRPGTYTVTVSASQMGYTDEQATAPPGTGTAGTGTVTSIVVTSGATDTGYNFLELPPTMSGPGS